MNFLKKITGLTELQTDLNPFNILKRTQISVGQNMMNPSANPEKPYWNPSKILNFKPYELGLTQHWTLVYTYINCIVIFK